MKDNKSEKPSIRRNPNKKLSPKAPKFNIMWLYAVVVFALLAGSLLLKTGGGRQITWQRFESRMLQKHDVERIVAYKSNDLVIAEVYIKKDSLKKPEYNDLQEKGNFNLSPTTTPQYIFSDASFD